MTKISLHVRRGNAPNQILVSKMLLTVTVWFKRVAEVVNLYKYIIFKKKENVRTELGVSERQMFGRCSLTVGLLHECVHASPSEV